MRIVMVSMCAVLLGACCSAIAQTSNDQSATPPRQESPQKPPCEVSRQKSCTIPRQHLPPVGKEKDRRAR
jgi:hypothetical protein